MDYISYVIVFVLPNDIVQSVRSQTNSFGSQASC